MTYVKCVYIYRLGVSPVPWEQLAVIDTLCVFLREAKTKLSFFLLQNQSDTGSCPHAYLGWMGSLQYAGGPGKGSLSAKYLLFIILVPMKIRSETFSDAEQLENIPRQASPGRELSSGPYLLW